MESPRLALWVSKTSRLRSFRCLPTAIHATPSKARSRSRYAPICIPYWMNRGAHDIRCATRSSRSTRSRAKLNVLNVFNRPLWAGRVQLLEHVIDREPSTCNLDRSEGATIPYRKQCAENNAPRHDPCPGPLFTGLTVP